MKADASLIRVRGAQPPLQRTLWGVVTFAFWAFYVYLWMPALTLALWLFGARSAYEQLYRRSDQLDPFLLVILPAVALVSATVLILWAEYNRARFTGRERRGTFPDVPIEEIAAHFGAGDGVAAQLATGRISILHMDESAQPRRVTAVPVPHAASSDGGRSGGAHGVRRVATQP